MYFAFGGIDAYVIADLPDNVAAAALALAVNQAGGASTNTVVLMTPSEVGRARRRSPSRIGRRAAEHAVAEDRRGGPPAGVRTSGYGAPSSR